MFILTIIASWKLLVKSGEKGWKTLIPFYRDYVMYKQFYDRKLFWNILVGVAATIVLSIIAMVVALPKIATMYRYGMFCCCSSYCYAGCIGFFGILAIILAVVTSICAFVFSKMLLWYTGKAFGASTIHCLGMMFLTPIAIIALGFDDKYQYQGNPVKGKSL